MSFYGDQVKDDVMKLPTSWPRFANIARKIISHYLGDKYNPQTFDLVIELYIRQEVETFIEMKLFYNQPYDWEYLDNFWRCVLSDHGYNLPYDRAVLEKGYNGQKGFQQPIH